MEHARTAARRILIAPDKFKGTLTAAQAADAMRTGWAKARRHDIISLVPISDGGDGFGSLLGSLHHAEPRRLPTVNAAHEPIEAVWWWCSPTRTLFADTAEIVGLARLPAGKHHPFDLDTFGIGALLTAGRATGATRCIVGIGGSATNDAGFGMARALGWRFLDTDQTPILHWPELVRLDRVEASDHWPDPTGGMQLQVAVDVRNPLLGPNGATRIYGPQKGLTPPEFSKAEAALSRLARVLGPYDVGAGPDAAGAGAAGGLGFGLQRFAGGTLGPGFDLFATESELSSALEQADLVLTGEGSIDDSTMMGKGVGELACKCRDRDIDCVAITGVNRVSSRSTNPGDKFWFTSIHALTPDLTTSEKAMGNASRYVERAAENVAKQFTKELHDS